MSYTDKKGYLHRYFTRWVTVNEDRYLKAIGWEVCDRRKFDNIRVAKFDTQVEAEAVCKLMNSIEEENDGIQK